MRSSLFCIAGKWIELILPPLNQPAPLRVIDSHVGLIIFHGSVSCQANGLTLLELGILLYGGLFYTAFPSSRHERDNYMTIIFDLPQ